MIGDVGGQLLRSRWSAGGEHRFTPGRGLGGEPFDPSVDLESQLKRTPAIPAQGVEIGRLYAAGSLAGRTFRGRHSWPPPPSTRGKRAGRQSCRACSKRVGRDHLFELAGSDRTVPRPVASRPAPPGAGRFMGNPAGEKALAAVRSSLDGPLDHKLRRRTRAPALLRSPSAPTPAGVPASPLSRLRRHKPTMSTDRQPTRVAVAVALSPPLLVGGFAAEGRGAAPVPS